MNKRHLRLERIKAVHQEYLAATSAADLLVIETTADPSFGLMRGWKQRSGTAFVANLEATYIIRIYAEFEAALREYWSTYLNRITNPKMSQLLKRAIPTQHYPNDVILGADGVREYRNALVHDVGDEWDETSPVTMEDAKSRLCAYIACFDPNWR